MRKVPKGSPRYASAVARAEANKSNGMAEAREDLVRTNKIRAIVGQAPQGMAGKRKRKGLTFQR